MSANAQLAREEEGHRIGREIHDELGSSLSTLKWDLEALEKTLDRADRATLTGKIHEMMSVVDSTVNAVRRIAAELRPSILDDLGVVEAIEWQTQQFQARTGILCQYSCSLEHTHLNHEASTAVFRIFQEALTNVLRHAKATMVEITMREAGEAFVLTIRDNGRGIRMEQRSDQLSLGILGMQERARLVGGQLDIVADGTQGTLVKVAIPLADMLSNSK